MTNLLLTVILPSSLTVNIPCPFYLICCRCCAPDKVLRKRVIVNAMFVGRGNSSPSFTGVARRKSILLYKLFVISRRSLWRACTFWVGKINMIKSKFFTKSSWPLKIIHKWPSRITNDIAAIKLYAFKTIKFNSWWILIFTINQLFTLSWSYFQSFHHRTFQDLIDVCFEIVYSPSVDKRSVSVRKSILCYLNWYARIFLLYPPQYHSDSIRDDSKPVRTRPNQNKGNFSQVRKIL